MASVPAFLNGEYLPLEDCRVSVLDRGFLFGDGIYELITVYQNKAFYLSQHMGRLQRSMAEIKVVSPYSESDWLSLIEKLIQQSECDDLAIYIQVTRGVAPRDHVFPDATQATVFAMANPLPIVPSKYIENGVELITTNDTRWQRCDVKAISLLANILAKQEAAEADAVEAIMIRDDYALEGSSSNLFLVRDGIVYTHPKDNLILPGITRDFILELLEELGIECKQQRIPKDWLYSSDELWIASSTKELLAATKIDQRVIADGKPGKIWQKTYKLYQQRKM
ncbi:MAG: D-amino acid aminotransferase [Gammaproteobacteria bacterium]|nr:MAG: D-amino acid aminotransferase [Gammaproteobacteria bacterium]